MEEASAEQKQRKSRRRSKSLLKESVIVSKSERSQLRSLSESLRPEFDPQNRFEQFIFEKLMTDIGRLSKLYAFEQKRIFTDDLLTYHIATTNKSSLARFIQFKNAIEKDISNGYLLLKQLKNDRNTRGKSVGETANDGS